MAGKLVVLYGQPDDPAAFEAHYLLTHVPLVKATPGVRSLTTNATAVMTPTGPSDFYRVCTVTWDSLAATHAALKSGPGAAAAADLGNFATGGATILVYEDLEL